MVVGKNQLRIEIDRMMVESGWTASEEFSYAFTKEVESDYSDIESGIKADVDAATEQAEWTDVKYLYVIGDEAPKFSVSAGL